MICYRIHVVYQNLYLNGCRGGRLKFGLTDYSGYAGSFVSKGLFIKYVSFCHGVNGHSLETENRATIEKTHSCFRIRAKAFITD